MRNQGHMRKSGKQNLIFLFIKKSQQILHQLMNTNHQFNEEHTAFEHAIKQLQLKYQQSVQTQKRKTLIICIILLLVGFQLLKNSWNIDRVNQKFENIDHIDHMNDQQTQYENLERRIKNLESGMTEVQEYLMLIKLSSYKMTAEGIQRIEKAIVNSEKWQKFTAPEFHLNSLEIKMVLERLEPKLIEGSQLIYLASNRLKDLGIKYITKYQWPNVHTIMLGGNQITQEGISYLISIQWPSLKTLMLENNQILDEGVNKLIPISCPALKSLILSSNQISNKGLKHLTSNQWSNLQNLYLNNNRITDEGLKYLSPLMSLWKLQLQNNTITDEGIKQLVSMQWPKLSQLSLGYNRITDSGLEQLLSKQWMNLISISIEGNPITIEDIPARYNKNNQLIRVHL